jgi:hypothetical protein
MWSEWLATTLERAKPMEERRATRDRRQRIEQFAESDSFEETPGRPEATPPEVND